MGDKIIALLQEGKTYNEITRLLGCSKATINYHAKKLGIARSRRSYDWSEVQTYHNVGHSRLQCVAQFGFCPDAWDKAVRRGELVAREWRLSMQELTRPGRGTQRTHLKGRLIKAGVLRDVCCLCGITDWCGQKLTLVLDHINGVNNDNRPENLRLLCPNCNSQTDTFSGRNIKRRREMICVREAT